MATTIGGVPFTAGLQNPFMGSENPAGVAAYWQWEAAQQAADAQVQMDNAAQRNARLGGGAPGGNQLPGAGGGNNPGGNGGNGGFGGGYGGMDPFTAMMLASSGIANAGANGFGASQAALGNIAQQQIASDTQRQLGQGQLSNQLALGQGALGNQLTLGKGSLANQSSLINGLFGGGQGGSGGGLLSGIGGLFNGIFGGGGAQQGGGGSGFSTPNMTGFKSTNGPQSASFGGGSPTGQAAGPPGAGASPQPPQMGGGNATAAYNRQYVPASQLPLYDAIHGTAGAH